jgi:sarcosine oxidase subunit gamma
MAQLNGAMSARLGPDEWLLATGATELDPRAEITAGLVGTFHALVDIGHRNVGIEVAGRHAPEVLNGGCPLDLADHVFSPGTATRTIFGKAEIVLFRQGPERSYHIECWRSFAPYVRDLLMDTAREFR